MCMATSKARVERTSSAPSLTCARVCFASVEIREYPRILGDNPSVSSGPPITLAWHYDQDTVGACTVDEWESLRCHERRSKGEFRVPEDVREEWVQEAGYSKNQVRQAIHSIEREKQERRASLVKSNLHDKADDVAESVKRRLDRLRGTRQRSDALYAQWVAAQEKKLEGAKTKPKGRPPLRRRVTVDVLPRLSQLSLDSPALVRFPSDSV